MIMELNWQSSKPFVSVIIPTYNRGHLIAETIRSVLDQTYQNFEIIIVDDGSTDDTQRIIEGFTEARIRYILCEHTGKQGFLRNTGIKFSSGDYIAFTDSDDLWRADKLEFQLALLWQHSSANFVISNGELFGSDIESPPECEDLFVGSLLWPILEERRFVFYTPTWIFKKSLVDKVGYIDESFTGGTEFEYFLRICTAGPGIFTNQRLARIRKHTQNTTGNYSISVNRYENIIRMTNLLYESAHLSRRQHRHLINKYHYKLGLSYLVNHQLHKALACFLRCTVLMPWEWRNWMRLLQALMLYVVHRLSS